MRDIEFSKRYLYISTIDRFVSNQLIINHKNQLLINIQKAIVTLVVARGDTGACRYSRDTGMCKTSHRRLEVVFLGESIQLLDQRSSERTETIMNYVLQRQIEYDIYGDESLFYFRIQGSVRRQINYP